MCDFMAFRWYHALASYEKAMRIDEDVCLLRLPADPFGKLAARSNASTTHGAATAGPVEYLYGLEMPEEHVLTAETLTPWLKARALARAAHGARGVPVECPLDTLAHAPDTSPQGL